MKMLWLLSLLFVGVSAQAAQPAARQPGLDCPANRLSAEESRALAGAAMEQAPREDPRALPLFRAVETCGRELSWSPAKQRWAGMFTLATIGAAGTRELLGRRGVSVGELDQAILSDRELMAAAEAGGLGDNRVGEAFATRHLALLERIAAGQELTGEVGRRLGHYIAFRAPIEATARQFGRSP